MTNENKILIKFLSLLNVKIDGITFCNIDKNIQNLSNEQKAIIIQFKNIFFLKKNQRKILFYFDKKFNINENKNSIDYFINYLNEYNLFTNLVKKYDYLNYGIIITKTNKLLSKVK